jgi:hypothetical protein
MRLTQYPRTCPCCWDLYEECVITRHPCESKSTSMGVTPEAWQFSQFPVTIFLHFPIVTVACLLPTDTNRWVWRFPPRKNLVMVQPIYRIYIMLVRTCRVRTCDNHDSHCQPNATTTCLVVTRHHKNHLFQLLSFVVFHITRIISNLLLHIYFCNIYSTDIIEHHDDRS